MAAREEIKNAIADRIQAEGLVGPDGQPMTAMNAVIEAVTDGITKVESGGPHAATHAVGGSDAVTPADIGAETPQGAQERVNAHAARVDNPHRVTAAQAGAETPAGAQAKADAVRAVADAHAGNKNNPHGVTVGQIGAAPVGHKHTKAEVTDFPSAMIPTTHAASHKTGGTDPITPANIGAAPANHDHSGYVKSSGGTLTGKLTATGYGSTDTRSAATLPSDYKAEAKLQFKYLSAVDLAALAQGTYCQLMGYRAWSNSSGGKAHEIAFTDGGDVFYRCGTDSGGWATWQRLWHSGNDGSGSELDADTLDGQHASAFATAGHKHAGADITSAVANATNADTVDGKHASAFLPGIQNVNGLNMNDVTTTGFYYGYTMENAAIKVISTFVVIKYSPDWITQMQMVPSADTKVYVRARHSGTTWSAWKELGGAVDVPTALSQLINDVDMETTVGAQAKADAVRTDLNAHTGNKSNPHGVTTAQIGAATAGHSHTGMETTSGAQAKVDAHANLKNNPHGVTAAQVGAAASSHTHSGYAAAGHKHTKSEITDFPTSMVPTAHAASHKPGGTDVITPADIGAAASAHTHSGYASASHTHGGGDITGVVANATNADTVDGKHASAFASASHQHGGGDITSAVANATNAANADKISGKRISVQSSEPSNPADGDIWIQPS